MILDDRDVAAHTVWFLVFPDMQSLDLVGPYEAFNTASRILRHRDQRVATYELTLFSSTGRTTIRSESGLEIVARPLPPPSPGPCTLIIPGGDGIREVINDLHAIGWIADVARTGSRIATICTGAFGAAAAGLLDGKRAATHWSRATQLKTEYPKILVDADAIHVRDGNIWSSAGVTAGIDLALALIEHDHGAEIAQEVARWLVVFRRRPGGQSQFAPTTWNGLAETSPIRHAQEMINADPGSDLSLETVSRAVGVSQRHFSRLFHQEVGETPARYIESVRVSAARQHLEQTTTSVEAVANLCGFGSAETLRRAFQRQVKTTPDSYRRHHRLANATDKKSDPR